MSGGFNVVDQVTNKRVAWFAYIEDFDAWLGTLEGPEDFKVVPVDDAPADECPCGDDPCYEANHAPAEEYVNVPRKLLDEALNGDGSQSAYSQELKANARAELRKLLPRPVQPKPSAEDVIREANWQWDSLGSNATEDRSGYILSALRDAGLLKEGEW